MGAGWDFQGDSDNTRRHANNVREIQAGIGEAAAAGGEVAALDDAYGLLCCELGLPEIMRVPQERVTALLEQIASKLERDADQLDAAAQKYENFEAETLATLNRVRAELDGVETNPAIRGQSGGQDGGHIWV